MTPGQKRSRILRALRLAACPKCGAGNGEKCVTRTGNPATSEHSARYYAAVSAETLPLSDEGSTR